MTEHELLNENKEIEAQLQAGFKKLWNEKTVSLRQAAREGLRLQRICNTCLGIRVLFWEDGRLTVLTVEYIDAYRIEENSLRNESFMRKHGMFDDKALEYINERRSKIEANNKLLERFMIRKQLEEYKQKLEELDEMEKD